MRLVSEGFPKVEDEEAWRKLEAGAMQDLHFWLSFINVG
jgi:hypothetical protein